AVAVLPLAHARAGVRRDAQAPLRLRLSLYDACGVDGGAPEHQPLLRRIVASTRERRGGRRAPPPRRAPAPVGRRAVKITGVEAIILESPKDYGVHGGEASGPRFRSLLRVSTDAGIDGWAEVETTPHVLKAVIDAPGDGSGMFEGLGRLVVGEDPFETAKLWDKLYTGTIYYGRRGVVLQAISGIDIACYDIR